ncbi:MAG: TAT-variant-translocated molybdopterin oxidoreductase, partial [Phycisphaerae bacterium]
MHSTENNKQPALPPEAKAGGAVYWQSLEQLGDSPAIQSQFENEFATYDVKKLLEGGVARRKFLKIMGASLALCGLTLSGCRRWPREYIVPNAYQPKDRIPGTFETYATQFEIGGIGYPLSVATFDGRPVKVEGNQAHPLVVTQDGRAGASNAFAQASVLQMYDPERNRGRGLAQPVIDRSSGIPQTRTFDAFWRAFLPLAADLKAAGGAGMAVLAESYSGPTMARIRQAFEADFPQGQWYEYEAVSDDNTLEGARLAFGKPLRTLLNVFEADVLASFDDDLLGNHPNALTYSRDWAKRRKMADADTPGVMNRMYVVESGMSLTGSNADERLPAGPRQVEAVLRALAARLGVAGVSLDGVTLDDRATAVLEALAEDLRAAGSRGVVSVGETQPPHVHALGHAVNRKLGSVGTSVTYVAPPAPRGRTHAQAIAEITARMNAGEVRGLVILGGNPAYDAPADLPFVAGLANVGTSVHLSEYANETSVRCTWHVPRAHPFECWGDARAYDGSILSQQPMILPLFNGLSPAEFMARLLGQEQADGQAIVKETFRTLAARGGDVRTFEAAFRSVLHDGFVAGSAYEPQEVTARTPQLPPLPAGTGWLAVFVPDAKTYDGRFANNGWLQELPDPISKMTWDNPALIAKATADTLKLDTGDVVELTTAEGRSLQIAVYVMPGLAEGTLIVPVGYGRTQVGGVGNAIGFNPDASLPTARHFTQMLRDIPN